VTQKEQLERKMDEVRERARRREEMERERVEKSRALRLGGER
jgi:hypothetical protein